MFQQLPSYRHMLRTWQQQDLRRGPNRHPSSPKLSPDPKTREDSGKEAIVLYSEVICHSSSPTPEKRWKGRRVRGDGRRINSFLAEVWPSPLNTEPICPTVFEITPHRRTARKECPLSHALLYSRQSTQVPVIQIKTASSVTGRWGENVAVCDFTDREDCFSKNFCQWLWRTLCASTGDLKI